MVEKIQLVHPTNYETVSSKFWTDLLINQLLEVLYRGVGRAAERVVNE